MTPQQQDDIDRAKGEAIIRKGMDLIDAFLEGRAAIEVTHHAAGTFRSGDVAVQTLPRTVIRLRMDPTDAGA